MQFSAAGVTTVILACDYISTTVLTAAAEQPEASDPEWMQIGTAAQRRRQLGPSVQPDPGERVTSSGPASSAPPTSSSASTREPGKVYKHATGKQIPDGHVGRLLRARPHVQPAPSGRAQPDARRPSATAPSRFRPAALRTIPLGYWSLADGPDGKAGAGDHTDRRRQPGDLLGLRSQRATDRIRACLVRRLLQRPDGKNGTYKETYNGKRFRNGEWPQGRPAHLSGPLSSDREGRHRLPSRHCPQHLSTATRTNTRHTTTPNQFTNQSGGPTT